MGKAKRMKGRIKAQERAEQRLRAEKEETARRAQVEEERQRRLAQLEAERKAREERGEPEPEPVRRHSAFGSRYSRSTLMAAAMFAALVNSPPAQATPGVIRKTKGY